MALKDVIIGYAKGDKGDKGDTGERGATGQTGPQGEPGNIADAAITDTQGLDVAKGAKTTAQKLFDAIADRIVNKLVTNDTLTTKLADYLLKSAMSSTNIDSTTNVPTSALVYSLMQDVNNNLSNRIPFETKVEESSIASRIILMQKAGYKAAVFCSKDTCSDNPPTAGWYNILYWGMASEQIILASCTWQPKTTYYGVFNLDETAPTITWREVVTKNDLVPIQKGSTFLEDIGSLSSPSQLKHAGFYKLPTMTADVNADAGTETMTEYTTGDFYGLLLGSNINTTDGCEYGTLIVSSPRIRSAIWVGSIWQKKFISWYKIGKS